MNKIATVIALTCLPALPAAAATMTVVGTGIISSGGYDYTGVFGDVGTLTGQRAGRVSEVVEIGRWRNLRVN